MSYENEKDLIKVLGWTRTSKLLYIMKQIHEDISKEDIYKDLVEENKLMKPKSFQSYWNQIDRIKDDIQFV